MKENLKTTTISHGHNKSSMPLNASFHLCPHVHLLKENTFNKELVYYPSFTPTNKSMTPHLFVLYSTLQNELTHTQLHLKPEKRTR